MANFLKLVQNENMKVFQRVRTWIMIGIIIVLPILISLGVYLSNGAKSNSYWSMMQTDSAILYIFIIIFTVVVAAESVAGEFTWGTIKLLLIRPWSRSAILLSKYVSMHMFALALTAIAFVVTFIINVILFNGPDASETANWDYILKYYLFQFIVLMFIVSFGFMMSSAFRSGGLAIGLSISLLFAGTIITGPLSISNKAWVEYLPFMHIVGLLSYISDSNGPFENHPMSLGFSLAVLAGYFVLFNLVSWTVFRKRDVAA
ncbi:ABC transporter permease [Cohnella suwonensis]|uniref:ABC transporter permease n=1 Tax=Cohnella suwonensis TaxID=696072 RepID=A0ABW0M1Y9_9BACL